MSEPSILTNPQNTEKREALHPSLQALFDTEFEQVDPLLQGRWLAVQAHVRELDAQTALETSEGTAYRTQTLLEQAGLDPDDPAIQTVLSQFRDQLTADDENMRQALDFLAGERGIEPDSPRYDDMRREIQQIRDVLNEAESGTDAALLAVLFRQEMQKVAENEPVRSREDVLSGSDVALNEIADYATLARLLESNDPALHDDQGLPRDAERSHLPPAKPEVWTRFACEPPKAV